MNDIEAALKTNTLWRAPHSKFTVGLPRLNLNIDSITLIEGRPYLLPQPRTLAEHLLCQSDRLPGLANYSMGRSKLHHSFDLERYVQQAVWADK